MLAGLKEWARRLKQETYALALACRDPRVPWYARLLTVCVVAYVFSPIDLIPDPIPLFGYLDDLILVPLGIALVVRLIPPAVLAECRASAAAASHQPVNWVAAGVIIAIWLILAALAVILTVRMFNS
jgi:uncharacterized membrane protein YkvA (DUF1232 family)